MIELTNNPRVLEVKTLTMASFLLWGVAWAWTSPQTAQVRRSLKLVRLVTRMRACG